jgi:hypothetical protein
VSQALGVPMSNRIDFSLEIGGRSFRGLACRIRWPRQMLGEIAGTQAMAAKTRVATLGAADLATSDRRAG